MLKIRKFSGRNRSMFDIVAKILRELQDPTGISDIISSCNLNFKMSGYYLGFMMSSDLVETEGITGRVRYHRTEAGKGFLESYDKMILMLEPNALAPA